MFCEDYEAFVTRLTRRQFLPHTAANGEEAKKIVLDLIGDGTVGCGGSVTTTSLGLQDALRSRGNEVYFHWDVPHEQHRETFEKARRADWYLCSSNAITRRGCLINIDGNCNRVSSMMFGPRNVVMVIGKNKFAEDYESAMERVKRCACIPNVKKFQCKTPCSITEKCSDCFSPDRICRVVTMIEFRPKTIEQFHLILVDEELGF